MFDSWGGARVPVLALAFLALVLLLLVDLKARRTAAWRAKHALKAARCKLPVMRGACGVRRQAPKQRNRA